MNSVKILIVIAKYYEEISNNLLESTISHLISEKVKYHILEVPGALEIPQAINFHLGSKSLYDGCIALGCVIKGKTYHFEIVCNETNRGLMELSLKKSFPIGNGVITSFNYDDAFKRSFKKGEEASKACLELIKIKRKIIYEDI